LNDIEYFKEHNPCSEVIAKYIYEQLKTGVEKHGCQVSVVRVWETDTACAEYSE
jgi:6-pyruvoyl-tetrahydropterin synthase